MNMAIMILCQTKCSVLDILGQNSDAVTFVVATKEFICTKMSLQLLILKTIE